jgi:hypothetical protein
MRIVGFYHTPDMPGWNEVMSDQLSKMSESGLLDRIDELHVCMNGNPASFVTAQDILKEYTNVFFIPVSTTTDRGEYPTINYLKDFCDKHTEEFYVMYTHLKGLSKRGDPCRNDWRQYMDYWQIERWEDNVAALDQNYETTGINYNDDPTRISNTWPHYSGNFWWARSSYIRRLEPLQDPYTMVWGTPSKLLVHGPVGPMANQGVALDPGNVRYENEAWIGSQNPAYFELAHSPGKLDHDFHANNLWPREHFEENVNPLLVRTKVENGN